MDDDRPLKRALADVASLTESQMTLTRQIHAVGDKVFEAGQQKQIEIDTENQRRQLDALGLLGEFTPSCDLVDAMGERLLRERRRLADLKQPLVVTLPPQPVDTAFDSFMAYGLALQAWERVCKMIIAGD